MKLRYLLPLLAALPGSIWGASLDINTALRAGLQRSPSVAVAVSEREVGRAELSLAKRGYLPSLQLGAGSADGISEASYEIRASQTLLDWGARRSRVRAEQARLDGLGSAQVLARQDAYRETSELYIDLYQTRRLMRLHQVFLRKMSDLHRIAGDRATSGYGDRIEAERTAVELAKIRQSIARFRGQLRSDGAIFETVTGLHLAGESMQKPPSLPILPMLQAGEQELTELIRTAPQYQYAAAQKQLAEAQWQQAKAERFPTLNLEASWEQREIGGRWESDSSVGLQFRFDTGPGFRRWGEAGRARHQLTAAAYRQDVSLRDNLRLARQLQGNEPALRQRIAVLNRQAIHARTVKETYRQQFLAGTRDLEDLISIEREVFETLRQRVELEGQLLRDQYQLACDLGLLDSLLTLHRED